MAVGNGDGVLWFEVRDDGAGFDPALAGEGHGFVNMRDRLGAFGGELEVRSVVGEGTTIRGTVPRGHGPWRTLSDRGRVFGRVVTLPGSGGQDPASLAACQASRSTAGLKSSLWT